MNSSKNIVIEGWLTKSPPTKRLWRTKWRRRWFALRQSGELPGQYILDYYAERNCRRLKGSINLDLCQQVDSGLHIERNIVGQEFTVRGSIFTIRTLSRVYHLEADSDTDMENWVDAICRVCGLRAAVKGSNVSAGKRKKYKEGITEELAPTSSVGTNTTEKFEPLDDKGVYIPISECITGVRTKDSSAFTFDRSDILASGGTVEKRIDIATQTPTPKFKMHVTEISENESNVSEDDSKVASVNPDNTSRDWMVAKTFTKLTVSPKRNGHPEEVLPAVGPPVPPRPPKTFAMTQELLYKEHHGYQGPKIQEPMDCGQDIAQALPIPGPSKPVAPPSPRAHCSRYTDDGDDYSLGLHSMQYSNLPMSLPPAVDRALKPRRSSHSMGPLIVSPSAAHFIPQPVRYVPKDTLQYLDLDLHTSQPPASRPQEIPRRRVDTSGGKSLPDGDNESAYKTVDFLKTEAFKITRQDAEASRNFQN